MTLRSTASLSQQQSNLLNTNELAEDKVSCDLIMELENAGDAADFDK